MNYVVDLRLNLVNDFQDSEMGKFDIKHSIQVFPCSHDHISYILSEKSINLTWPPWPLCFLYCYLIHIFWEGHKILRNLHLTFVCMYCRQKQGGDFAKLCGLTNFNGRKKLGRKIAGFFRHVKIVIIRRWKYLNWMF